MSADLKKPSVSVVIPTYNYAGFVGCAIDSALKQTYRDFEVIVVDDGSTDNTREVLAQYGDRVRYVHQSNAGLSAARNTGIMAASGEYVAFLDSDDAWEPTLLEKSMQRYAELPREFGLMAAQGRYVNKEGVWLTEVRDAMRLEGEIAVEDVLVITRFSPSSVVARRQVLIEAGMFDTTLRSSEDRDMWVRVGARRRMYLQGETLALIRKHGNNMSSHADRMKANMRVVLEKTQRSGLLPQASPFFWMRAWSVYYYQTAVMYLGGGRFGAALGDILRSFLCWPFPLRRRQLNTRKGWLRPRTLVRIVWYWIHPQALETAGLRPESTP
jgi:glycosyltransferase involved in cell wall biosynthesis